MDAKLIVVEGKSGSNQFDLKLPTVIGRSREADLRVPHPLISRKHCEISEADGVLLVRDLGSLNGTFVEGNRIKEAKLQPGQKLTIGSVTLRAVYGDADDNLPETTDDVSVATVKIDDEAPLMPPAKPEADATLDVDVPDLDVPDLDIPLEDDAPLAAAPVDDDDALEDMFAELSLAEEAPAEDDIAADLGNADLEEMEELEPLEEFSDLDSAAEETPELAESELAADLESNSAPEGEPVEASDLSEDFAAEEPQAEPEFSATEEESGDFFTSLHSEDDADDEAEAVASDDDDLSGFLKGLG